MSWIAWRERRNGIPYGAVKAKIRDGQVVETIRLPKKDTLYTNGHGTLHVPIVVNTSDGKRRIGDCVIKYNIVNPVAIAEYMGGRDFVDTSRLACDIAYEVHGKVVPQLAKYTSDVLPEKQLEIKAMVRNGLGMTFNRLGLGVYDIFPVWGEEKRELADEKLKPILTELEQLNKKTERLDELEKRLEELQKELHANKKLKPKIIEKHVETGTINARELPNKYEAPSDARLRDIARREAERFVMLNPEYSSLGRAEFWVNMFEQMFYDELAREKNGAN